jgi:hypothetical protein
MNHRAQLVSFTLSALISMNVSAQVTTPGYTQVGTVKHRTTAEIVNAGLTNPFGIGGETTDRKFSYYNNWKEYLDPLGATKIRIQTGWAYIETDITVPPTYNFTVLDEVIKGAISKKLKPFVFLGYGNSKYTNGGSNGLGASIPSGAGLDRFLDFVKATVNRYNTADIKVTDWEIWNEPDGHMTATAYADMAVKVAKAIKAIQPEAKLTIGSFTSEVIKPSGSGFEYGRDVIQYFDDNKGSTVPSADVYVSYHPYWLNPDYDGTSGQTSSFNTFSSLVSAKGYKLRQGENGAPSEPCATFALCGGSTQPQWDEANQAKYMLRRMLGDFARGIETNIFTITDLHYNQTKNVKGLLRTGTWDSANDSPFNNGDQSVKGKKAAYGAFQNVTGIFDSRLKVINNHGCSSSSTGFTIQAYTRLDGQITRNMLAVWRKTADLPKPPNVENIKITCTNFHFSRLAQLASLQPRYVDLLDGRVYSTSSIVSGNSSANNSVTLTLVPVGDHPVLIADQGIVLF